MTKSRAYKRSATLTLLFALTIGVPASTLALPSEAFDADLSAPQRADTPPVSSIWDQPAAPAPVVTVRAPQAPLSPPERALSANPLWEIPLASLSNTRERPVFSPSRRPPPPAVAAPQPTREPPPPPRPPRVDPPQLLLVGTVAGDDEGFGIFVDPTTKAAVRLKVGEDYEGWKLRSVQGREVTLEQGKHSTTLSLPQPGTGAPGTIRGQTANVAQDPDGFSTVRDPRQ